MSRLPLEDALPAAYPSPDLPEDRKNILNARLDTVFADARVEAARRVSKHAAHKRNPARILLGIGLMGIFGFIAQSLASSALNRHLEYKLYFVDSKKPIHRFIYNIKEHSSILKEEHWELTDRVTASKSKNNDQIYANIETYILDIKSNIKSKSNLQYSSIIIPESYYSSNISNIAEESCKYRIYFSGIKFSKKEILICIKNNGLCKTWLDLKTGRMRFRDQFDKKGNPVSRIEWRYDETPPPGIFNPERLKAMAKRAHSTAPARPR